MVTIVDLTQIVNGLDNELTRYARGLLMERAKRPPFPRERVDIDFLVTRVGRMQQFLKAAHLLAQEHLGSSVAPIARAMWETWIDTAWVLLDPNNRAAAFWASAGPHTLALFELYEKYEPLTVENERAKTEITTLIDKEPELYSRWTKKGKLQGFNQIRWQGKSVRQLVEELQAHGKVGDAGKGPYMHSYDYVYSRLCSVTHGDAMELDSLMADLPDGSTAFFAGAGGFSALSALLSGCGAALLFLVELCVGNYQFGDYALLQQLKNTLDEMRGKL